MSNKSKSIEEFLLTLFTDNEIELSRNELANYFNCVPSQINYVLSTRFTYDKGYVIESQRGGGGYIKIKKIQFNIDYLSDLINELSIPISEDKALNIAYHLKEQDYIDDHQYMILKVVLNDKSLSNPFKMEDSLRSKILTNVIKQISIK